ncbi:thioesterase family protein [Bradyrhizobium sp. U87765 SZCCT0131]|uniref:thioesterase family protein n=1 Tax=unclassified Bradyrhizobium TaxID=2631580 RepID=UPI001BAB73C8|nr:MULTISPECIES: thioesterase family protein [unclassified Bradyrhizobium]MBR1222034.1 thioesterase family protein [Bradyrhizobium sp. U87765 SZCCT0131]MBR1263768.1 thioesterase family protein [Bradyrhizobium sp. U87765 SZCCT0134]MBR1302662.1 thioesterase family protein [Bradyrhizobium sp. U87765 SZCCT0110]MBR1320018.1 thioesterase family protein [Bradyrhizobium sp. U87765 SZCCT0109]MBR1348869.1 thioesterase family protein [Bradyrhizobium sp. U87765 SZCCT0048]
MTAAPRDAIFRVEGNQVWTSPLAGGPWDPRAQHGSPPAALVAWIAEAMPSPVPMHVARLTIDLMRPVPVAPLTFTSEVVKEGRKIQLCDIRLFAEGVEVVRASVLRIRTVANVVPEMAATPPLDVPPPDQCVEDIGDSQRNAFLATMTMRPAFGRFIALGRAAIWFRANLPLVEGQALTPLLRAVIASDFCNGTSPSLDFAQWTFINADLTINLARQPVGDWILVNAESYSGPDGAGLSIARLADGTGYFGRVIQSLVVERRAPARG